jgi:hypothetical protein
MSDNIIDNFEKEITNMDNNNISNLGLEGTEQEINELKDLLCIGNYSLLLDTGEEIKSAGFIKNGQIFSLAASAEVSKLDKIVDKADIWKTVPKTFGKGGYTSNRDDENLQISIVGNIVNSQGKKVMIMYTSQKKFNQLISNSLEQKIITSITGIQIMRIDNNDPNPDISRFNVDNVVRNTIEKREVYTSVGKVKLNNLNFENKVMLPETTLIMDKIIEADFIISREMQQLSYDMLKEYYGSLDENVKNDSKFKARTILVHCSDFINYLINQITEEETKRDKIKNEFYRSFPSSFNSGIKVRFSNNITKTLSSIKSDPSYSEVRSLGQVNQFREFIKKNDFYIPSTTEVINKFSQRIIDFQILSNELHNIILYGMLGINYETIEINKYLHYKKDCDVFNIINNDIDMLEKVKDSIRMKLNSIYENLRQDNTVDVLKEITKKV